MIATCARTSCEEAKNSAPESSHSQSLDILPSSLTTGAFLKGELNLFVVSVHLKRHLIFFVKTKCYSFPEWNWKNY